MKPPWHFEILRSWSCISTQLLQLFVHTRSPLKGTVSPLHRSWRHVMLFIVLAAGRSSAALQAARAAWPCDWLWSADRAGACGVSGSWGGGGCLGLWEMEIKWCWGWGLCFGGGVGGQRFGICKEQQRCSCASAPWHFPNLITDEDRLPSLYLASTFPNLHRRISVDKARLGKCWHPLENS